MFGGGIFCWSLAHYYSGISDGRQIDFEAIKFSSFMFFVFKSNIRSGSSRE